MNTTLPKVAVLAAAVSLAMSSAYAMDGISASGNNARSMSLQSNYFSLKDDFNIWANPALINDYSDRAYINHTEMGGANVKVGPGTLGLYFGRTYSGTAKAGGMQTNPGTGIVTGSNLLALPTTLDNRIDAIYGMEIAGMNVGGRLNWNSYGKTDKTTGAVSKELSARDINISAGIAMKSLPLDVAVTLGFVSLDNSYSDPAAAAGAIKTESLKDKSAGSMGIVGRFEAMNTKNGNLMVSAGYVSDDASSTYNTVTGAGASSTSDESIKISQLSALANYNYTGISNTTLGVTSGLYNLTTKTETVTVPASAIDTGEFKTLIIPLAATYELKKLGESQKWALRGSLSKALYVSTSDKTTNGATVNTVETSATGSVGWGIGVGYNVMKGLNIDANMNQGTLFAGTNLLSTGAGTLITRLTVTYEM